MAAEYPSELWRRLAETLAAGDLEALGELLDDDAVVDWSRSRGPFNAVYEGRDSAISFFVDLLGTPSGRTGSAASRCSNRVRRR